MSRTGKRGQVKLSRGKSSKSKSSDLDFEELFNKYIFVKTSEGLAESTLKSKRYYFIAFRRYLSDIDPGVTPYTLDTDMIREYIYYLKHEHRRHGHNYHCRNVKVGTSDAYINTVIRHWKAFYNFLVEDEYIIVNPFQKIKQIKEPDDNIEALTVEQIKALVKQPNKRTFAGFRDYVLIMLLLDTGMRISEALSLKNTDINYKENVITLGGDRTKNKKMRYVPFTQKLNKLLREMVAEIDELGTAEIFINVYGDPLKRSHVRQRLKNYGQAANIKGVRVSPHTLRHTFAKHYLLKNGDVMTLQKILGHSSLHMVRRYVNMTGKDISLQHSKYSPINFL